MIPTAESLVYLPHRKLMYFHCFISSLNLRYLDMFYFIDWALSLLYFDLVCRVQESVIPVSTRSIARRFTEIEQVQDTADRLIFGPYNSVVLF